MVLVVVMGGGGGDKAVMTVVMWDSGDVTYKYFIILFILQGESEVVIKSFNTLCTMRTGWLSGNNHF